ncbi:MAG: type II toxin-antitoxin system RelE/ParE family toxin [Eubacteriales bacterium]|nr:type II toxin-antitoxin system RelE/ParE family toxin [Eubacteriales bacterium]
MIYRLHITGTAERDLIQAAEYIEFVLKNPSAADALLEDAECKINALLPFPKEHPLVDDKLLASWGIRFIQIKNYLAFYIVSEAEQQITVIRFLYAKSNWLSILKSGFSLI